VTLGHSLAKPYFYNQTIVVSSQSLNPILLKLLWVSQLNHFFFYFLKTKYVKSSSTRTRCVKIKAGSYKATAKNVRNTKTNNIKINKAQCKTSPLHQNKWPISQHLHQTAAHQQCCRNTIATTNTCSYTHNKTTLLQHHNLCFIYTLFLKCSSKWLWMPFFTSSTPTHTTFL
jgi:hypothetical protein